MLEESVDRLPRLVRSENGRIQRGELERSGLLPHALQRDALGPVVDGRIDEFVSGILVGGFESFVDGRERVARLPLRRDLRHSRRVRLAHDELLPALLPCLALPLDRRPDATKRSARLFDLPDSGTRIELPYRERNTSRRGGTPPPPSGLRSTRLPCGMRSSPQAKRAPRSPRWAALARPFHRRIRERSPFWGAPHGSEQAWRSSPDSRLCGRSPAWRRRTFPPRP
jgi:hypothetical protein